MQYIPSFIKYVGEISSYNNLPIRTKEKNIMYGNYLNTYYCNYIYKKVFIEYVIGIKQYLHLQNKKNLF